MIQDSNIRKKMSERQIQKHLKNYDDKMTDYANQMTKELLAFQLVTAYENNALWDDSRIDYEFKDALTYVPNYQFLEKLDYSEIKKILKEKYSYELTNENPIEIKKIQQ